MSLLQDEFCHLLHVIRFELANTNKKNNEQAQFFSYVAKATFIASYVAH